MRAVLEGAEWWRMDADDFSTASWDEHKELLAAHLNYVDWSTVRLAYDRARSPCAGKCKSDEFAGGLRDGESTGQGCARAH
jgi:hypothetical protein